MIRLNKYISDAGICTRRAADQLIAKGHIKVNGQVINKLGTLVSPDSLVLYKDKPITRNRLQYVLFNKPKENKRLAEYYNEVNKICNEEIAPFDGANPQVSGLFLFTNDKSLADKLSAPSLVIHSKYVVELAVELSDSQLSVLKKSVVKIEVDSKSSNGMKLLISTASISAEAAIIAYFDEIKVEVLAIDRIEYGHLKKGPLTRAKSRFLSNREIGFFKMIKAPK